MDILAPISRNIIAPMWAWWERSPYLFHYRTLLKTQYDPIVVIEQRQLDAVRLVATHAYKTVPFWKQRFDDCGLNISSISNLSDLEKLPLLSKSDLRAQGDHLIAQGHKKESLHRHITSGSTGVSVTTYSDEECQQFKRGAVLRSDEWSGWRLAERKALIWGNPQIRLDWKGKIRRSILDRDYCYLDTLNMDRQSMLEFADTLIQKPPSMLFGHAHSLYLFSKFINKEQNYFKIRPKSIISTCMVLHDFERLFIEKTFSCSVTNRYGCEEVSLIACECEKGEGLHVNSDCLYVELIDKNGKLCQPGEPGKIVVTDLRNYAMPIIRYEVGDVATWSDHQCSCNRTLPLLNAIEGRVADYVVTSAGSLISGISLTENFAVKVPGIKQMQIVQDSIDNFTFNIVKSHDFGTNSLQYIENLTAQYFGKNAKYSCVFLDRILPEKSGKYRFCISKVDKSI